MFIAPTTTQGIAPLGATCGRLAHSAHMERAFFDVAKL